jgi:hypothetical protein
MGFRSLFKVRRPGNGAGFEGRVTSATKSARAKKFPSKDNSANSFGKNPIK